MEVNPKKERNRTNMLNPYSGSYIILNYFICSYSSPIVLWSRILFLPYLSHSTYVKLRLREIKENALCKSIAVNPSKSSSKVPDFSTMLLRGYIQQAFIMCLSYARCLIMVMEQELGSWRAFFLNSFIPHIFTGYLLYSKKRTTYLVMLTCKCWQILVVCWQLLNLTHSCWSVSQKGPSALGMVASHYWKLEIPKDVLLILRALPSGLILVLMTFFLSKFTYDLKITNL